MTREASGPGPPEPSACKVSEPALGLSLFAVLLGLPKIFGLPKILWSPKILWLPKIFGLHLKYSGYLKYLRKLS